MKDVTFCHLIRQAGGRLNRAHLLLGSILHAQELSTWREENSFCRRFCTNIFTTNFDTMLQNALQLVSKLYHMTDRPETLQEPFDDDHDAIHLIYTHGSVHQQELANTEDEIKDFAAKQAESLSGYFEQHGVILIGYSGWADSCMAALRQCRQFQGNLYWCGRETADNAKLHLRQDVIDLLARHRGQAFYVPIRDADSVMQALHVGLGVGVLPSVLARPLTTLQDRFDTIHNRANDDFSDALENVKQNLREYAVYWPIRLPEVPTLSPSNNSRISISHLKEGELQDIAEIDNLLTTAFWLSGAKNPEAADLIWTKIAESSDATPGQRATALTNLGTSKATEDDHHGAIKEFNKALAIDGICNQSKSLALVGLAIRKSKLGNCKSAIDDCNQVISMDNVLHDTKIQALVTRGSAKLLLDDFSSSIEDFDVVLANKNITAEQKALALLNRGSAKLMMCDGDCRNDWMRAAEMEGAPESLRKVARINLGMD